MVKIRTTFIPNHSNHPSKALFVIRNMQHAKRSKNPYPQDGDIDKIQYIKYSNKLLQTLIINNHELKINQNNGKQK